MSDSEKRSESVKALELKREAEAELAVAEEVERKQLPGWQEEKAFRKGEADRLFKASEELMLPAQPVEVLPCGEVKTDPNSQDNAHALELLEEPPTQLAMDASHRRQDLLTDIGLDTLELGLEGCQSLKASNSLEKMLIHQMAACHQLSMEGMQQLRDLMTVITKEVIGRPQLLKSYMDTLHKMTNCNARLMDVYQKGMLALEKTRKGGQQTVKVVHVNQAVQINEGAQAVVAGNMDTKGGLQGGCDVS